MDFNKENLSSINVIRVYILIIVNVNLNVIEVNYYIEVNNNIMVKMVENVLSIEDKKDEVEVVYNRRKVKGDKKVLEKNSKVVVKKVI